MIRALAVVALVTGCGRLGFDATTDAGAVDAPLPPGRWQHVTTARTGSTWAITDTGELWSWGASYSLQLGHEIPRYVSDVPERVGTASWKAIAGFTHACGIESDDTLWCWGENGQGELGNVPTGGAFLDARQVGTATWTAVSVGNEYTCGIQSDQSLWCWGLGNAGRLGNGVDTGGVAPEHIGTASWNTIALGEDATCGIQADDTLWCWGQNQFAVVGDGSHTIRYTPVQIAPGLTFAAVSIARVHACAITTDHATYCWGEDDNNDLGDGNLGEATAPHLITAAPPMAAISVGDAHSCGLAVDGTAWCWGSTGFGEIYGAPGDDDLDHPFQLANLTASAIAAGGHQTCAIDRTAHLFCWGAASDGQLGSQLGEVHAPTRADPRTDWQTIASKSIHVCGTTTDGRVLCWGDNGYDKLGDGTSRGRKVPVEVGTGFTRVTTGDVASVAIHAGDQLTWAWGLSPITGAVVAVPTDLGLATATIDIAVSGGHGCRIESDGSLYCAGDNDLGQLGDGTQTANPNVQVAGTWAHVATGGDVTCAIDAAKRVSCWGNNDAGQLGVGSNAAFLATPTQTAVAGADELAVSAEFACARAGTTVSCWGANGQGQLGQGTYAASNVPVPVLGHAFQAIAAGDLHVCGITTDGALWCWGHGDAGQLGDPNVPDNRTMPIRVGTGTDWAAIALGNHVTCGIRTDHTRWCWGDNHFGQIGDGGGWSDGPLLVP